MKWPVIKNPIRGFAVLCVAVIAGYVMWMGYRLIEILSSPTWCRTALGAEKVSPTDGTIKGIDACVGLLMVQLKSLATNSHILFGVVALCLLTLIVIVIAGGKVAFTASKTGLSGNISRDDPGDSLPVTIVNPPNAPVPTAEAGAKPVEPTKPKFTAPPGEGL